MSDSPSIGRFCGANLPTVVESSGNMMKVIFRTDGSISNGGFRARYTSLNEQSKTFLFLCGISCCVWFWLGFFWGWGGGGGFKRFNFVHHHCIEFAMEYICKNENYFLDHYALDVVDLLVWYYNINKKKYYTNESML